MASTQPAEQVGFIAQATEASPVAVDIMRDAFESTREVVNPADIATFHSVGLRDVIRSARALEERMAERQELRDMARLQEFFEGVQRFEAAEGTGVLCRAISMPILSWLWVSCTSD